MNNTNSLVWYKFLGNLTPEEKRMQLARVFFFWKETEFRLSQRVWPPAS